MGEPQESVRVVAILMHPDDTVTFDVDPTVTTTELLGLPKRLMVYAEAELDEELEQQTLDE
jgi:anion-transporting  ArsA/GET3 family ATPase